VHIDEMLDGVTAHRPMTTTEEERTGRWRVAAVTEVGVNRFDGLGSERCDPLLAPFPPATDVGSATIEPNVFDRERCDFRDTQASLNREEQQRVVATAKRRRLVRRREERFKLRASQEGDELPLGALVRDRQHTLDEPRVRRLAERNIPKE
jgi:hypothetical protein